MTDNRRLDKKMRQYIEDSAIAATHFSAKKQGVLDAAAKIARKAVLEELPQDFAAATKHLPAEWFPHSQTVNVPRESHPDYYFIQGFGRHYSYVSLDLGEPVKRPNSMRWLRPHEPAPKGEKPASDLTPWSVLLSGVVAEAQKLQAQEETARTELRAVLMACQNVRQLVEKMPSLARHVPPAPAKSLPLVVSPAKAESLLKKAGFDTGAQAA